MRKRSGPIKVQHLVGTQDCIISYIYIAQIDWYYVIRQSKGGRYWYIWRLIKIEVRPDITKDILFPIPIVVETNDVWDIIRPFV